MLWTMLTHFWCITTTPPSKGYQQTCQVAAADHLLVPTVTVVLITDVTTTEHLLSAHAYGMPVTFEPLNFQPAGQCLLLV